MNNLILAALAATTSAKSLHSSYTFDPLQHLSGIAPYFEPQDPPRNPSPPQGCNITKAAYLVRHAAINANSFDYESYLEPFIDKLANHTAINFTSTPSLAFLETWVPPQLTEQSQLTRTGKLEAAQLGVTLSYKYPNLRLPRRIYSSTASRTLESAKGLIRGLETSDNQINLVQIYEGKESGADNLTPYKACPAYSGSTGSKQSSEYISTYTAPITARLNAYAPTFNFTSSDITAMFQMCGYETVIRGSSPFCDLDLFSPDEWLSFEYANDIMYFYNTGYGNPISGPIGFPWLNETMNLLSAPSSADQQESQDLTISVTHRELPPTVLVAMGLFNNSQFSTAAAINDSMPLTQINYNRAWKTSHLLAFLSNIAIEKMDCGANYAVQSQSQSRSSNSDSTYYRVLVNNAPQTLPDCHDGPAESCSSAGLQSWLAGRAALFEGFSEKCNVSYSNSTDQVSFYTDSSVGNGTTVGKRWMR
ncbi:hypothetical protein OHC33_001007 [Knufia fluminis]|uniref:Uncharacterized protein n=1 Tax=Knufia fluminis TaxID=191047 RepID=A0AAN8ESC9_9EURO|nr:hypothetical protein OHC33_001007 [Knufia fluminis]